jgi:L-iditol 2-dehydrogenase
VGKDVKDFKEGDRVAVHNTAPCNECYYCKKGLYSMCSDMLFNRGAYSEYVKVPERIVRQNMFVIDQTVSHKTASLMEPFSCAVYGIENCPIHLGDNVVVNGAGPIGLMFARLAVMKGAKVLVTDMVESRLDLAKKLGVWKTCNLTGVEDTVEAIRALTDENRGADIVIEATGLIGVWETSIRMARKGGFVLLFGGTKSDSVLHIDPTLMHYSQITVKGVFHTTPRYVRTALELLKMGAISGDDFVQNEYRIQDLEQAIREHASGKVIKNCIVYE